MYTYITSFCILPLMSGKKLGEKLLVLGKKPKQGFKPIKNSLSKKNLISV